MIQIVFFSDEGIIPTKPNLKAESLVSFSCFFLRLKVFFQIIQSIKNQQNTFDHCEIKLGFMETMCQKLSCTLF